MLLTAGKRGALTRMAAMAIAGFVTSPCRAIDYQPFDWIALPPGTNAAEGLYEFGKHDAYNSTISSTKTQRTGLDSHIGVARYVHYDEHLFFGHQWDFQAFVPFGSLRDGELDGSRLGNASGVGDPVVSAGVWFVNQPEHATWFSAADFVTLPIGSYDRHQALNLASNRWQNDSQIDITQGFGDRWTADVSVDWIHYGDNPEAGAGSQRLEQAATYNAFLWVSYDLSDSVARWVAGSSHASISIGYAATFGGSQRIDTLKTGAKTEEQQIRLTYMMFLAPTWQGLVLVSHDLHVAGQFDQEFGMGLR